jgi:hypothetical protein
MIIVRAGLIGVLILAACGDDDDGGTASADGDGGEAVSLAADDVVAGLAEAGLPVELTVVYTEASDPNDLLGRPGGYTSKASFVDTRIDEEEVSASEEGSVELGGGVEVFEEADQAKDRSEYIQSITEEVDLLGPEYNYVEGPVLLRLSKQLTPTQAKEYEVALADIVAGKGSTAGATTTVQETPTTEVQPAATLASPYLQGTLDAQLPPGEPNEVTVIAVGPPQSATRVVVRNNTPDSVEVHLSGTARDASGALIASGEDQGVQPAIVEPGHVAIGYVYLGIEDLPEGTAVDVTASGEEVGDEPGTLPAAIIEHNIAAGEFDNQQIVGSARNDNETRIEGPISVLALCFDEVNAPVSAPSGFLDVEALDAGQVGSFSVEIFDEVECPRYLVGASGYSF